MAKNFRGAPIVPTPVVKARAPAAPMADPPLLGAPPFSTKKARQVKIDIPVAANAAAGADARGGRGGSLASAVIGIAAASSAVTMVAAGAVSPPLAFGLFVLLLGGLSLAVSGVGGA